MTISLRLDPATNRRLTAAAKARGVSKSELVRMCLAEYLDNGMETPTAWELGKHLFGRHRTGRADLSTRAEEILRERFQSRGHAKSRR